MDDSRRAAELRNFIDRLAAEDRFCGTALVARGDRIVFSGAWGPACRRFAVPNRLDTKFNLGSMNKMFTAVAIAQLVESGELRYDDRLSERLEGWLAPEIGSRITIRQLLSHTSGLGSYFEDPRFWNGSRLLFRTLDDYRPLATSATLAFEPGEKWAYSNTGYLLAGAMIETVSGQSYPDYVRARVCGPLGMTSTDCYDADRPVANLASGYTPTTPLHGTSWEENSFRHVVRGGPAGGGYSTVEDLWRFARGLRGDAILSPESIRELWTPSPQSVARGGPAYGMGFIIRELAGGRSIGHSGTFAGISNTFDVFPDFDLTIVTLGAIDRCAPPVAEYAATLFVAKD